MVDGHGFLREAAILIERGWCRGADARDHAGLAVAASDSGAIRWSLLGALVAVSERPDSDEQALRHALWGISGVIPDSSLDGWNEATGRTQGDTLQMLAAAGASLGHEPPPDDGSPLYD